MSTKRKVRARKMWRTGDGLWSKKNSEQNMSRFFVGVKVNPVYVLPADAESYDAMVLQVAVETFGRLGATRLEKLPKVVQDVLLERARAILASIGIVRPTTRK